MTNDAFQQRVIEDLAALNTKMDALLGNGQPGRITNIETDVKSHGKTINRLIGGLLVINFLIGAGFLWRLFA